MLASYLPRWGLLLLPLLFAAPTSHADENVIKIGILHSLSGTMAISEIGAQGYGSYADSGSK